MRKCSLCHADDRPVLIEGGRCNCGAIGDVLGHSADCQTIEHYVQKDIQFHDGPLTKRLREKGWQIRTQGFRNRPAIERFICVPCIHKQADINEVIQFKKKASEELDPDKPMTMYQILSS